MFAKYYSKCSPTAFASGARLAESLGSEGLENFGFGVPWLKWFRVEHYLSHKNNGKTQDIYIYSHIVMVNSG